MDLSVDVFNISYMNNQNIIILIACSAYNMLKSTVIIDLFISVLIVLFIYYGTRCHCYVLFIQVNTTEIYVKISLRSERIILLILL